MSLTKIVKLKGYNPDSLTPLGERQAEAVAKRLAVHGVDKIFSSTSNRAYRTALPLSELTKKEITQIDFFNEKYAWEYFSIPTDNNDRAWIECIQSCRELLASNEIMKLGFEWYSHPDLKEYRFKEGIELFDDKIDGFLLSLGYEHNRKKHSYRSVGELPERVAIFAHGGFGGVFISSLMDIPYPIYASHYGMPHTGVTAIEFNDNSFNIIPRVLQFSNDAHLYREGLPTRWNNSIDL